MPRTPETPLQLINDLLDTLDDLGSSGMARIDARAWYGHFARRAKRIGWQPAKDQGPRTRDQGPDPKDLHLAAEERWRAQRARRAVARPQPSAFSL